MWGLGRLTWKRQKTKTLHETEASSGIFTFFACFIIAHVKWVPTEWRHKQVRWAYIQLVSENAPIMLEDPKATKSRWGSERRVSDILPHPHHRQMQWGNQSHSVDFCGLTGSIKIITLIVSQSNHWVIFHLALHYTILSLTEWVLVK